MIVVKYNSGAWVLRKADDDSRCFPEKWPTDCPRYSTDGSHFKL